jgi:hypothetical protein
MLDFQEDVWWHERVDPQIPNDPIICVYVLHAHVSLIPGSLEVEGHVVHIRFRHSEIV